MPKFTTPKELWARIDGLQSVGGAQYEGNSFISNTLRYVKPYQGIDVECENRYYGDGVTPEGFDQLDPEPLPIKQQTGDVVEDRDKRIELGTITESDRGFWEDINFDESTLQPFLTSNLRKTVQTRLVSVPDEIGTIVYKEIPPGFSDREYSIDALPFVTDPNNDNEIIRVDKYYDKEINLNEYSLATEGKINYYLYPRKSGRFLPDFAIDTYKHKGRKVAPGTEHPSSWFDRSAEIQDDESGVVTKNKGYFVFNLDWGDGSPKEHNSKPKLLESSVMLDHHYEKPGFYTITGTVFKSQGFKIDQYERFRTNILLNPSKKYELDLFRYRNFATIGGISTSSTLVKSVSSMIGLDPFDFDANRVEDDILDEYNELDKIDLLNFMNMVSAPAVDKYREKYIEPYSAVIDDTPETVLNIPEVIGCMDPNGDNYVTWATFESGSCEYSFTIEGSINGMGGQTPIFFIGQVLEADGNHPNLDPDRYFLYGGAYEDWNNVVNAISTNEIVGGFALVIAPSTIYPELSLSLDSEPPDEPDPVAPPFGFNPSTNLLYGTLSSQGQWVWTNGGWVTNPDYQSQSVPFDGWTIPDGILVGEINRSESGAPIINQIGENDLPSSVQGQGFGYEIDVPSNLFDDTGTDQRAYIIKIDPDNPPSVTNYSDQLMIANWSGDTEDTGLFDPGTQLFYATVNTEVIEGDGTIQYNEDLASGQEGIVAGDVINFTISPSANQRIHHIYYNLEEVLPGDSRIVNAYSLETNQNMPANYFYETVPATGLSTWAEDVSYTFEVVAETDNAVGVKFSMMSISDEIWGDTYVAYDTVAVVVYNSPGTMGTGPSGVRFTSQSSLINYQVAAGLPTQWQGSYNYNYEVPGQYNNMVNYNPEFPTSTHDYVVATNQPVNNGPYVVKFDRDFMNELNENQDIENGFGYFWMGWFRKNPNDPTFNIETDLLSISDEYEFYTIYNEGEGANNAEQYFPTLIPELDTVGPALAVYAYVNYIQDPALLQP